MKHGWSDAKHQACSSPVSVSSQSITTYLPDEAHRNLHHADDRHTLRGLFVFPIQHEIVSQHLILTDPLLQGIELKINLSAARQRAYRCIRGYRRHQRLSPARPLTSIFGQLFVNGTTEIRHTLLATTLQVTPFGLPRWVPMKAGHDEANADGSGALTIR